jgi:protein transport protein SEC24
MFGLYCQPFAELGEDEKPIPVVQSDEGIFRCKRCQAYINSKYEMGYSNNNKQTATCNICSCPNELDSGKNIVKNEYFGSNFSLVPELSCPTIDFTAPTTMKHANPFRPQYLFMIDISQVSYDLGFYNYILNSIITNLEYFHNAAGSYVAFATYDHRSLQFFTIEKSNDVKAYIVADIMNPFCPLPANKLFFNVVEQKSEIEKIVEKINYYVNEKYQNPSKKPSPGSISGAAIKTGIEALEENGGRVMLFSCNSCLEGYAATKPREESKILNTKDEKTLFLPQHEEFNKLSEVCLSKRIVVDQFIFASNAYDLATYSGISNSTGGCVNFYPCTSKDVVDIKYKFEKLHYDLSRVLTRPNYYDVKFMLRFSLGIDTIEILGPFNKKLGVAFQVSGCDPDYSFGYNLRLSESLKNGGRYHFQLVCLYIDNFNQRYLRTFNYTVLATNEISKIYTSADVDSLAKLMVLKEASLCHHMEINLIRENLNTKIINSFLYYRNQCSKHTPVAQLILPASIKYLPLYLNSLIKKSLLKKIKKDVSFNSIIGLMNKLMREPIYHTCKFLYPKFFRIDDIQYDQSSKFKDQDSEYIIHDIGLVNEKYTNLITKPYMLPLSLDHIDFYCAYLSDDGEYINLYIFNYINPQFYQELFGVESWEEAVQLDLEALDEGNTNDLNIRLLNIISQLRKDNKGFTQPVRLYFLE